MTGNAHLSIDDASFDYPVMAGSVGPEVVDIRKLYANTGRFTYDPGFTSTAACESKITYIDGDAGIRFTAATRSTSSPSSRASWSCRTCC